MKKLWLVLGLGFIVMVGCNQRGVQKLSAENDSLKRQVDSLTQKLANLGYSPNASSIEQLMQNQMPSFAMLSAVPGDYLEKRLILYGYAKLSGYYNCGYSEAQDSYYSVELFNRGSRLIYVYFPKSSSRELFELLGKASSDGIPMKIEAVELRTRYDPVGVCKSDFLAEGISWEVLK